jgi:hypothetical protein
VTAAVTDAGLEYVLRDAGEADDAYALDSATRCVAGFLRSAGLDRRRINAVLDSLRDAWDDGGRQRVVAHVPGDPDAIMGVAWGLPTVPLLDYVHVRGPFRGLGLARALASAMGIERDRPALVGFPTADLCRPKALDRLPIGVLGSGRWPLLTLRSR